MGMDEGFDMVPRLGLGAEDTRKWSLFMETIKTEYAGDNQVEIHEHYIEFKAGEHPTLPFHGPHFLRFSSKVSGRIASETGVQAYLGAVRRLAVQAFGSRIRPWSEVFEIYGFYDWLDVHESLRSFWATRARVWSLDATSSAGPGSCARGRYLSCATWTPEALNSLVATKLRSLSKDQQMQFLSLHNNFPGKHAFAGIVRTNALPCGPGAVTGGVYPETCRINHSCRPNCHNSWNEAIEDGRETIHAIRDIFAGEELTIPYDKGGPSEVRQAELKAAFGFDCKCDLCTLPAAELQASDECRRRIQSLDEQIGNPMTMMNRPLSSLHACRDLLDTLRQEYTDPNTGEGTATALIPRLYYDALQIVVAHGDQARGRVFAERCYAARVECEGEDSPATLKAEGLMREPSSHASFGAHGRKWRTSKTAQPNKETVGGGGV
ncbi:uncharacterized protein PG986_000138 [Apiospora aurea]|uniref:SET domain-containing protein n=1 Tax=Apiospora aurea TaxID=335848 RepID=A0ABR1QT64_9PEZI